MLTRQKELHPDKFSSKGENEVALARELSGRINDAFAVLMDPLRRAEYILSTHALATIETDSTADPELLGEILEAREELESATSVEAVETLRQVNSSRVQAAIESIKEAFGSDPPNLAGARILAVKLKYWQGLEEAAKDWTPKL
ncbi:MAG: hypothetical protein TREMPRED_001418 [Tremellales sp. Tagirdzhanova-0007]|nr:MAG: hypothetical protein TREMPRED_001418 [Tremellales sp. Tagirdzhanova-0007]